MIFTTINYFDFALYFRNIFSNKQFLNMFLLTDIDEIKTIKVPSSYLILFFYKSNWAHLVFILS